MSNFNTRSDTMTNFVAVEADDLKTANRGIHNISVDSPEREDISTSGIKMSSIPEAAAAAAAAVAAAKMEDEDNATTGPQKVCFSVTRQVYNQPVFDDCQEARIRPEKSPRERCSSLKNKCECSPKCVKRRVLANFPFIGTMMNYSIKKDFLFDLIAGLTISVVHIPQGMAYAMLANVEPVYGLYTSFFGVILYFLFGTSRHISVGVSVAASLMVGSAVDSQCGERIPSSGSTSSLSLTTMNPGQILDFTGTYADMFNTTTVPTIHRGDKVADDCYIVAATTVTFMSGVIQLLLGFTHLGSVVIYLSEPLTRGFTTGAAVHVLTSQLKHIFGVSLGRYTGLWKLIYTYRDLFQEIHNTNVAALVITVICFIILWCTKVYINPRVKKYIKAPIPVELIVIILVVIGCYFGNWEDKYDLVVVGNIPKGLPAPAFPSLKGWSSLIGDAIATAIVTFAVSVSVAQLFADKHNYKIDANQELVAHGVCSVFGCNFNCIVASASMSRSVILESLGGHTQLSGMVASLVLLLVLVCLAPLLEPLPNCVLGAIVLVALKGLFMQFTDLKKLWKISKIDLSVWLVVFVAVVLSDIAMGLGVGVMYALLTVIARTQSPYCCLEGRVGDTDIYKDLNTYKKADEIPAVKVFRFESSLYFANTSFFKRRLYHKTGCHPKKLQIAQTKVDKKRAEAKKLQEKYDRDQARNAEKDTPSPDTGVLDRIQKLQHAERPIATTHHIIIDCTTMAYVDSQGITCLRAVMKEYKAVNVQVLLAGCKAGVRQTLERGGFYEKTGRDVMFPTVHDAVLAALQDFPQLQRQLLCVPRSSQGEPPPEEEEDAESDEDNGGKSEENNFTSDHPVQIVVSNGIVNNTRC